MSTLAKLLLVLTLMPILEITLLVGLHSQVGEWWTIGIVICTAVMGTLLIKWQGGAALRRIKETIGEGRLPGDEILDGVLILAASIALITPGVLTDTTGLLLLVPTLRAPVRRFLGRRAKRWLAEKASPGSFGASELDREPPRAEEPAWQAAAAEEGGNIGRPDEIL